MMKRKQERKRRRENKIIRKTADYVKGQLSGESTGHDWWHTYRVWKLASFIAEKEDANLFVVQIAALLHDIADWKFHGEFAGVEKAKKWLYSLNVPEDTIEKVCTIIKDVSFKGAGVEDKIESPEGRAVQDADRLDALGAIGVARAFAYGGFAGKELHNPEKKPVMHKSFQEYKHGGSTTVNHFYEKLFLLKDRMNTPTAKKIAESRHRYMKEFLERFFREWSSEDLPHSTNDE